MARRWSKGTPGAGVRKRRQPAPGQERKERVPPERSMGIYEPDWTPPLWGDSVAGRTATRVEGRLVFWASERETGCTLTSHWNRLKAASAAMKRPA